MCLYIICLVGIAIGALASDPFAEFHNKGLVAAGRMFAATFDQAGSGRDTLGGFSALAVDFHSLKYRSNAIHGILYGLPDRGFGDGASDYRPRIEKFSFSIEPVAGSSAAIPNQIKFSNTATILLTDDQGKQFTGYDPGNGHSSTFPVSEAESPGGGRRSLDPEGLVILSDGSFWVSDEYSGGFYKFSPQGELRETLSPPQAFLPKVGPYPGKLTFTATNAPASGRRNNRGPEGLSITPDGKRLVAMWQSPLMQDGGGTNVSRNTRILQINIEKGNPDYGRTVAEYIYQLTLNGTAETNKHTIASELLALDENTFLVLERDSNGRGGGTNDPVYKKIVLAFTDGASNLAGSGFDLETGAPGHRKLPIDRLPPELKPVRRSDFVDMLNPVELARFGLNTRNSETNEHCLSEKWEALGLVPLNELEASREYLLLVANDNDFKTKEVFHNGVIVGTNKVEVDIMILGYQISLPQRLSPQLKKLGFGQLQNQKD